MILLGSLNSIDLTPDDRYLITGAKNSPIVVFDIQTEKRVQQIESTFKGNSLEESFLKI